MLTKLTGNDIVSFPICAFDTEDNSKGGVLQLDFCRRINGKLVHDTFTSVTEAIEFIYSLKEKHLFVAHNLEYDIINLTRDVNYWPIKRMTYTARLISAKLKGTSHLFVDSFNYYAGSLADMGKVVGIEKKKMDLSNTEYVETDTEILFVFMEQFQERVNTELGLTISPTIGKMALQTFRRNFLDRDYIPFNDDICRAGYYGGRCEMFHKGEQYGKIKYADINSMYPDQMRNEFPDTDTITEIFDIDTTFGISEVTIKIPESLHIGPLPYRTDKLIYPVGTIRGTWTNHEIRNALEYGCEIIEYHNGQGTDIGVPVFRKFVEHYYGKRQEAKDDFLKTFYKLLLNSSYGKYFQHNDYVECRDQQMGRKEEAFLDAKLQKVLGPLYFYEVPMQEPPRTANYIWGCYVTSYARIKLYKILTEVHKNAKLLYCDTDSAIYLELPGMEPNLDLDQKRLGALKVEDYNYANFIMAKGYILRDKEGYKTVCKGVPQPRELEKNKIYSEENPRYNFLLHGKASFDKPVKLRESASTGETPNYWREVSKEMRTIYERRNVYSNGETSPILIQSSR